MPLRTLKSLVLLVATGVILVVVFLPTPPPLDNSTHTHANASRFAPAEQCDTLQTHSDAGIEPVGNAAVFQSTPNDQADQPASLSVTAPNPHPFQPLRTTAAELRRAGDMEGAKRLLMSIVDSAGPSFDRADASRQLGTYEYFGGNMSAAIAHLEASLEDFLALNQENHLALPTLNLLSDLQIGRNNDRAVELFPLYKRIADQARDEYHRIAARKGEIALFQTLGGADAEAQAIRDFLQDFPDHGKQTDGSRASYLMRLATLADQPGTDQRLVMLSAIAQEPWLRDQDARPDVMQALTRERLRHRQFDDAVALAIQETRALTTNEPTRLESAHEQMLFVIMDYPDRSGDAAVRRALQIVAQRGSTDSSRATALERLERLR